MNTFINSIICFIFCYNLTYTGDIINDSNTNFWDWWNDGESKFKKITYLFDNWWNNGKYKPLKAIYVSIFLHIIFAIFYGIYWIFGNLF